MVFMRRYTLTVFMLLAWLLGVGAYVNAQSSPMAKGRYADIQIITTHQQAIPGEPVSAALHMELAEGWHVYWKNPGDSGLPPEINWQSAEGVAISDFSWPAPHLQPLPPLMNYGYEDSLTLPFSVTLDEGYTPGDEIRLKGEAEWLICKEVCVPDSASLEWLISIADTSEMDERGAALISEALNDIPQPISVEAVFDVWLDEGAQTPESDGHSYEVTSSIFYRVFIPMLGDSIEDKKAELHFFPYGHDLLHAAKQEIHTTKDGLILVLSADESLANLEGPMEGVLTLHSGGSRQAYEIVAIKGTYDFEGALAGLSKTSESGKSKTSGYNWIGLIFAALIGGLILNLMPCVLPVLSIKVAGLASAAENGLSEIRLHSILYTIGVVSCFALIGIALIMLRAAGEQAGLGFQLQYPPIVVALTLLVYLIGLNLLGVFEIGTSLMGIGDGLARQEGKFGAFFTGFLAAIVGAPCVGPFLAASLGYALTLPAPAILMFFTLLGLGMAAPFLAIGLIPALAGAIPKPGKWMTTLKEFLAFPMFITMIWLLWVLLGSAGETITLMTLLAAIIMGLGLWLIGKAKPDGLSTLRVIGLGFMLIGFLWPVVSSLPGKAEVTSQMEASEGVWSAEKVIALRSEGKGVFVDFTARWCVTCQANKRTTLMTAQVKRAFSENNITFLTADWTNRDETIAAELTRFDRAGVPLYLYYPPGDALAPPQILPQILTPQIVLSAIDN